MRKIALVVLCLCALAVSAVAVSLCDARAPQSWLDDARIVFDYRYFDDPVTPGVDADSGRLAAAYELLIDSPGLGFSAAASCDLALVGFLPTAWLERANGNVRIYVWPEAGFFACGSLESIAGTGLPGVGLEARAGVGLGRIADVTPLARAMAIDAALRGLDAVPNGLSDDVLEAVADLVVRSRDVPLEKTLADIEAVVEFDAGVELDARSLLAIEEVVREGERERRCGWIAQLGIGYELLDPYGRGQHPVYAGSVDAAWAGGPEDQLLAHASYSGPFAMWDENTVVVSTSYVLDFAPDASLAAEYSLARVKPEGAAPATMHRVSLGVSFDLAFASLGLELAVSRIPGDPGWMIDVSMSAALDLL